MERNKRLEDNADVDGRELCADLVKVTWTPELETPKTDWAILGDISPAGACLELEEPIPTNAAVELEFGDDRCRAQVQYCKFDKVNYIVGVEFLDGYRWSRSRWKPGHLIQFRLRKVADKTA
ncbi:MAG: PilZ domain-containing protein [Acidobacteriota bacterium]|nr:PilZ domain-containing protein [Acidobacteriota bacterium]